MFSVLVALFIISYSLLTTLVVEQGRTIDVQGYLIRQLFDDSAQLTALKGTLFRKQHAAAQAQAEADAHSQAKTPPSQVTPRDNAKGKHSAGKPKRPIPPRPPEGTAGLADARRVLISI